jgi:RNA polymerase sigma-70 factor, ECF subfamily
MAIAPATRNLWPGNDEPTDHHLLQQACDGEQVAFETLVQRYQRALYRFVRARLDSDQAQDVVQFVLLQLYLAMPRLRESNWENSSLKSWLFRVAQNRCLDELRRKKRQSPLFSTVEVDDETLSSSLLDPDPLPEGRVEEKERHHQLHAAIQALPPPFRAIVWLRYEEELPFPAIAQRLNIPTTTARTYFYRACKKLRAILLSQKEGSAPGILSLKIKKEK